jgi:phosphatidylinositol alpha-1,6-mannosyltransferase
LLAQYRDNDLFVLPVKATRTDVEGFGLVYAEAAASGLPVLASRAGLATDAIVDGTSGILLDSSSPEAIKDGIVRFLRERARFAEERVRAVAEAFRWRCVAPRVRSILDRVARS